jgi:anti-sigma factor ChrR (cupin superfamily)
MMTEKANPGEPRFLFTDAASMPWRTSAYAEGVEVKDLGTANGRSMQLVRCRPGTIFPTHHHRGPEFIYILEGEAIQNGQRLSLGWAGVAQAGTLDEQFRSETGCVFLIVYNE